MSKNDLSLQSRFMDACVAKDSIKALRLAVLMAKKHDLTLKAELDRLDFNASILSNEYRFTIQIMIKELRRYEV